MPTVTIPTDLSSSDAILLGQQLCSALAREEKVKADKATAMGEFKSELDGLASRIKQLRTALESGRGEMQVEVDEVPGPTGSGIIFLCRKDTGEKVGERKATDKDRQATLPMVGDDHGHTDEQEAATPAEAEALRRQRLEDEHNARNADLIAQARERVVVTEQDGGGFIAALAAIEGVNELREIGETADEASEKVIALFAEALPPFQPEVVAWGEVAGEGADGDAMPTLDEIASAPDVEPVAEVSTDMAEPGVEEPTSAPIEKPKKLLRAPKGTRSKRMTIQDEAGNVLAPTEAVEEAGAPDAGGGGAPAETKDDDQQGADAEDDEPIF